MSRINGGSKSRLIRLEVEVPVEVPNAKQSFDKFQAS